MNAPIANHDAMAGRCSAWLADLQSRLQQCNERKRALLALPQIKHDMTLPLVERLATFERLQSVRVAEDISIMAEALDVMKQLDAFMSANRPKLSDPAHENA
jgi:hypothetical protein